MLSYFKVLIAALEFHSPLDVVGLLLHRKCNLDDFLHDVLIELLLKHLELGILPCIPNAFGLLFQLVENLARLPLHLIEVFALCLHLGDIGHNCIICHICISA